MTNFLRTLFAMLVNIPWATQTKALRGLSTFTKSVRAKISARSI